MRIDMRRIWTAIAVIGLTAGTASARPITYTLEYVSVDATLGGATYDDTTVSLTMLGDTKDIVFIPEIYYLDVDLVAITIAGGPTVALSSVVEFQLSEDGRFSLSGLLNQDFGQLVGYDLASSVFAETDNVNVDKSFTTPLGNLSMTRSELGAGRVTFTAVLGPAVIPEPSSLALAGLGALTLAGVSLRGRLGGKARAFCVRHAGPAA